MTFSENFEKLTKTAEDKLVTANALWYQFEDYIQLRLSIDFRNLLTHDSKLATGLNLWSKD